MKEIDRQAESRGAPTARVREGGAVYVRPDMDLADTPAGTRSVEVAGMSVLYPGMNVPDGGSFQSLPEFLAELAKAGVKTGKTGRGRGRAGVSGRRGGGRRNA